MTAQPLTRFGDGTGKSVSELVREELQALARGHATFLSHSEKSWASITFAGTRHRIEMAFEGPEAVCAGENFVAFLPEHDDWNIPGQLVADAAVVGVEHRFQQPRMDVQVELLLLDEQP